MQKKRKTNCNPGFVLISQPYVVWLFSYSRLRHVSFHDGPPYDLKSLLKEVENLLLLSQGICLALCSISRLNFICMLMRNKLFNDLCVYIQCQEIWKKYVIPERGINHKFRLWLLFRSLTQSFTERFGLCILFSHLCIYSSLWFMGYIPPFQMWACFKCINRFGLNLFLQFLHVSF